VREHKGGEGKGAGGGRGSVFERLNRPQRLQPAAQPARAQHGHGAGGSSVAAAAAATSAAAAAAAAGEGVPSRAKGSVFDRLGATGVRGCWC